MKHYDTYALPSQLCTFMTSSAPNVDVIPILPCDKAVRFASLQDKYHYHYPSHPTSCPHLDFAFFFIHFIVKRWEISVMKESAEGEERIEC